MLKKARPQQELGMRTKPLRQAQPPMQPFPFRVASEPPFLRSSVLRFASSCAALAAASMVALASARVLVVCWWVWTYPAKCFPSSAFEFLGRAGIGERGG